jgi:hypothetical protein
MEFDQDVRRALARKPAPQGFAQRVVAQLGDQEGSSGAPSPQRRPVRQWLAAAAAGLVLAVAGAQYYVHRQTMANAERAQRDVMIALQIAADKFALVKQRLDEHEK